MSSDTLRVTVSMSPSCVVYFPRPDAFRAGYKAGASHARWVVRFVHDGQPEDRLQRRAVWQRWLRAVSAERFPPTGSELLRVHLDVPIAGPKGALP